jgi:hypothetical protein
MVVRIAGIGLVVAALLPTPAVAQRTKFEGLRQCERYAAVQFRRSNPLFRRFVIDRASIGEDKFADRVGTQFVSTLYYGKGMFEAASGPKPVRFICMHAGYKKGPLFVYTLPE